MIEAGQVYRHYKGHIYRVVAVAKHSETLEAPVVYSRVDGEPDLWVRPAVMFAETLADGRPRFEMLQESDLK